MRNFKKRTIALVLASVVTVAGSFASERYKNSLMGLTFETAENGVMSMVVQTKKGYSGNLTPIKRDADTYILTLPEMNSKATVPDLTNNPHVQSVNIRTMPYTNNGSGYTRITIKTNSLNILPVQHRIFLPDSNYMAEMERQKNINQEELIKREQEYRLLEQERIRLEQEEKRATQEYYQKQYEQKLKDKQTAQAEKPAQQEKVSTQNIETPASEPIDITTTYATKDESSEALMLILGVLIIVFVAFFCYVKAKDKMIELSGESLDIDVKDENSTEKTKTKKEKDNKKINKIKNTIKTLDSTYSKTSVRKAKKEHTQSAKPQTEVKPIEEISVVDLDQLFQEQIQTQKNEQTDKDVENQALEDFLSGFSFDEEFGLEEAVEEKKELYNEELYEQIISGKYKFSKNDVICMNKLLQTEINDDTFRNINKYLVSNPLQKSKEKVLEEIMTSYAISQNINFTGQDVETLYKLINLEIDSDFITNLRTNPERTKEVEKEIKDSKNRVRKPSEIITLKVSEALPDLSEAIKKQGNKKVDSNYKPETVYFSEGYEVATLSVDTELPDLSKEINNEAAYASKPSETIDLVDNSYKVKTLSISSELPDLSKIMQNSKNLEEKEEEKVVVDEKTLLENISNVAFKPFDDNSQNFEVLNDFDDFYAVDDSNPDDVLSFEEIAAEFEELYSEKITNNKEEIIESSEEKLVVENNFDNKPQEIALVEEIAEETITKNADINVNTDKNIIEPKEKGKIERPKSETTQKVLDKIREKRQQKNSTTLNSKEKQKINKELNIEKKSDNKQASICVLDNESYEILSTASLVDNKGCYLAKNTKGYFVIGYIGNKLFNIKTYETLKSEKIQARLSEKLENGNLRYIVRIGINKFIIDLEENNIKLVMDLC